MAAITVLSLLALFLLFSISAAAHHRRHRHSSLTPPSVAGKIRAACQATRFADFCESSLSGSSQISPDSTPVEIITAAISLTSDSLSKSHAMVGVILASGGDVNRTTAAKICLEVIENAVYRAESSAEALQFSKIKDVRTWLSAVHTYSYASWSALSYVNGTQVVDDTMTFLLDVMKLGSNALSMAEAFDANGGNLSLWSTPKTERGGFWETISTTAGGGANPQHSRSYPRVPTQLLPNITVCKAKEKGSGCYPTVQAAVNAAPANSTKPFVIKINEGVYRERVTIPLNKPNIVILGDGMGKTVITGMSKVAPGITTYNTATLAVTGDGFRASGLTIENAAPPETRQAVAFRSESDMSFIENCEFLGNQDTLYVPTMRQHFKECRIEGNVDFIFGNAAVVFDNCIVLIRPRQTNADKGEKNAVTAHGRTDPGERTGFVFRDCVIDGTDDYLRLYLQNSKAHKNYLGRPWKEYSRTVVIQSNLSVIIHPDGWLPWNGDFALSTLYYGEFANTGAGASTAARVSWSSKIPAEHVDSYSLENFIQRDTWSF